MNRLRLRPTIPFVTATPLQDVALVIAGLPLWWVLGIEQFAYPLLLLPPLLKVLVGRRRVVASSVLTALLVFLAVYLASALFIVETDRYATFVKNLATYVTAAMLLVVVPGAVRTWADVRVLLRALTVAMAIAGVAGLLAVLGVARGSFASPFGALLPSSLAATALGSNIVERSLGWTSWFAGLGTYFRISSVFLWPTSYAPAITLTLPLIVFAAMTRRGLGARLLGLIVALLLLVNLVFTTGRAAAVGLGVVGLVWFFVVYTRKRWMPRVLVAALAIVAAGATLILDPGVGDVVNRVEQVVYARGTGSPSSRLTIYARTLEGFAERPLLGWGTERNIQGVADTFIYPAGSHSYLLGTLYRQGFLGFVAFVVLWWTIWRATSRSRAPASWPAAAGAFLGVGRAVVVGAMAMSLTVAFDLDASLMFVWWVFVALVVAVGARRADDPFEPREARAW